MIKRTISIILILVIPFVFVSCGDNSSDIYIGDDGVEYMICRDSDGELQLNENGKLLVYTLNENGKRIKSESGDYITEYVSFNGQVVSDRYVEIPEMSFILPDGFVDDRENAGYFFNENYKGEIFINYFDENIDNCIQSLEYSYEGLLESFGSEVYSYERYSLTVDDFECVAFEQLCTSSEYYQNVFVYLIPYDDGYYRIDCNVNTDNKNKVDFDKFIKSFLIKQS